MSSRDNSAVKMELREKVIAAVVAAYGDCGYHVTREQIIGDGRDGRVVKARRTVMFILWYTYLQDFKSIGRATGRTHATVIYNCGQMQYDIGAHWDVAGPYRMAMDGLGKTLPKVLNVMQGPKPGPLLAKPVSRNVRPGTIRPKNWTPEERAIRKQWIRDGAK